MPLYLGVVALSTLIAIVQISFVRSLPSPFSGLELPLLLMTALAMRLRTGEAIVSSVVAGAVAGIISSYFPGVRLVLSLVIALITVVISTRIFSHRSTSGTIAITCTAYLLQRGGEAGYRLVKSNLAGTAYLAPDAPPIIMGLLLQLFAVLLIALFSRLLVKSFSSIFIFR